MADPVGPKGPFSGLASGAGASAAGWYSWQMMRDAPVYLAGPMAGLAGTVGYIGGLAVGDFIDDFYRSVSSKDYTGKPAIAYSNQDMLLVSAASVPVSYVVGTAAAEQFGAGMIGTVLAAGGLSLFSTMAFMLLNEGGLGIFDTVGGWFSGGQSESKPTSTTSSSSKPKVAPKRSGIIGDNPIDNYGAEGRPMKRENTLLAMRDAFGPVIA